jgi:hypothetical protein
VTLNGRPRQPMVDPDVDLAAQQWSWRAAKWILPLHGEVEIPASEPELAESRDN